MREFNELSVRAQHFLENAGIKKFEDLQKLSKLEMLKYKNVGKKTIEEIEQYINECNEELINGNASTRTLLRYKINELRKTIIGNTKNHTVVNNAIDKIIEYSNQVSVQPTILYREQQDVIDTINLGTEKEPFSISLGDDFVILQYRSVDIQVSVNSAFGVSFCEWYWALKAYNDKEELNKEEQDAFDKLCMLCTTYIALFFQTFCDGELAGKTFNYLMENVTEMYKKSLDNLEKENGIDNNNFNEIVNIVEDLGDKLKGLKDK